MSSVYIHDKNDNKCHLIQLRNPHAKSNWNFNSSQFKPQSVRELKLYKEVDGMFWMEFKDFINIFSSVSVCKYSDNYLFSSGV